MGDYRGDYYRDYCGGYSEFRLTVPSSHGGSSWQVVTATQKLEVTQHQ